MLGKFVALVGAFGIRPDKGLILVAVSGGVDSMVLLSLFHECGFRIGVAHCNYQLRADHSECDEELVRNWCSERDIPFHHKSINTLTLVEATNSSIQMVARNERYAFFNSLMVEYDYEATALAHHSDDRVESLLINILRGTGIRGLQGMPSKRGRFFRPLISVTKAEIIAFAESRMVPFRNDSSNAETDYQRNWIRLRLLPMIQAVDSDITAQLRAFCTRVESELPNYETFIQDELKKTGTEFAIEIKKLNQSKFPFTVLKETLDPLGFSSEQVFEVLGILDSISGKSVTSQTHCVARYREFLIIEPIYIEPKEPQIQFELIPLSATNSIKPERNSVYANGDRIVPSELKLRKWQQGDRFKPLGMKGWKKLSDFFIDAKLSAAEKQRTWLLTYGNDVVWVVGMRLDDRFKVNADTQKVLKISAFF